MKIGSDRFLVFKTYSFLMTDDEGNQVLWIIEEVQESKVLLRAQTQMSKFIRVKAFKISPVSPSIPAQAHLEQTLNFQFDLPFHWKLESWDEDQLG